MRHFTISQEDARARETRNLIVYREITSSGSHDRGTANHQRQKAHLEYI